MTPLYFGSSKRSLFGAYYPAARAGDRGVVLCAPWGSEYLCAHPTLGLLARQLGEGGSHVLRFDYYGTGDSAGEGIEVSLTSCVEDVRWALDEIRDMAHARRLAVVGLRLGAVVALRAALDDESVDKLVLWDPIFEGRRYLQELLANPENVERSAAYEALDGTFGPVTDVAGFPLTQTLISELESVEPSEFDVDLPSTLLVSTSESGETYMPLESVLRAGSGDLQVVRCADPTVWVEKEGFGAGGMAVNTVRKIAEWMS